MTDIFSKQKRSQIMSRIRSKGSTPEILVRRVIHRLGYRFRLHVKNLPGKPDLVLKRHKLIVLVHGCFWHRHQGCKISKIPKSNTEFWVTKFEGNLSNVCVTLIDNRLNDEFRNYNCYHWYANGNNNSSQ